MFTELDSCRPPHLLESTDAISFSTMMDNQREVFVVLKGRGPTLLATTELVCLNCQVGQYPAAFT
jgi:hypothetical protein